MALLTIPSTPTKGSFQNYSINVADLIALVPQTYFQDQVNWKRVIVTYVSTVSNQISLISFTPDELLTELTAPGFFATEARSTFQVSNISIYDKQNGRFRLERSQIPNVEDYNLIFASASSQLSFYGIAFSGGDASTSLSFNANNSNELIIGTQNAFALGASATWETVLNLPDGGLDSATTLKIMDSEIINAYYNNDLTKAWVIGQFGLICCGQALPALPTDTASYGTNPFRLVEIDLVANTVTLKADIRQYSGPSGSGTYLGNTLFSVIVDETASTALVTSGAYISSYSMSSGNIGWFKTFIPIYDPYIGSLKPRIMLPSSTGAFIAVSQYDGVNETNNGGIIKISFSTGEKVPGYDATPSMSNGKYSFWASSPDTLKQVIPGQQVGSEMPVVVFNNGVASVFNLTNPDSNYAAYAVTCTNDHFYIVGNSGSIFKYDYLGNFVARVVSSGAWTGFTAPTFSSTAFGIYEGFLYCADRNGAAILKFNESTGARVSSFLGLKASQSSGTFGQFFFFSSNKMIVNKSSEYSLYPYTTYTDDNISTINAVSILDYTSRDLVSYLQTSTYLAYMNGIKPLTTTLLPNKIIGLDMSNGPKVYDTTQSPWALESGWPVRNGIGPGLYGAAIIGDYIYIGTGGGAGGITMEDSLGSFVGTQMVRININTKLIDRTFSPVFANINSYNAGGIQAVISETDNYIYQCVCDTFGMTAGLWRIKKSDLTIEQIEGADIGLSGAFGYYKINITQIASNTILIFPDKSTFNYNPGVSSSTTFDGKPYLILNETTLAQTGTQSSVTTDAPIRLVYNPNNQILGGLVNTTTSGRRLVTYDLSAGTRAIASPELSNYSGDNYLEPGTVFPMTYEGENFLFICAIPMIYGRRIYTGVIRMSPLGVLNN